MTSCRFLGLLSASEAKQAASEERISKLEKDLAAAQAECVDYVMRITQLEDKVSSAELDVETLIENAQEQLKGAVFRQPC